MEKEGRSRNKKSRSQRKNSNDDIIQDKSASKFDYLIVAWKVAILI